jgi:glycosyl transferase family 25
MTDIYGYVLTIEEPGGLRRANIDSELLNLDLQWEFVAGVRKGHSSLGELYSPIRNVLFSKQTPSDAEVATYASHRLIWERVAAGTARYGLVFEDDAHIIDRGEFKRALAEITKGSLQFDLVKFFDFRPKSIAVKKEVGKTQLVSHRLLSSGLVCYLISRDAAKKLLRRKKVYRSVDEDLSHAWEFDIQVWSVVPNPVEEAQISGAPSSLERYRNAAERNVFRSIYGTMLQAIKQLHTRAYHRSLMKPNRALRVK